ncbi:MAG: efflux RND transporter permease subunit, partial [Planctomycetaceae bacterium]|nr:efflux RND transporter permease subunit [Planctomycetaceae bacterium]
QLPEVKNVQMIVARQYDQLPEVKNVQMIVARQYDLAGAGAVGFSDQSHLGQLIIELEAADVREQKGLRSSTAVLQELRDVSENLAGVNSVAWEEMNGGPGGKDIELRISGNDFEEITIVSDKLKSHLQNYEGVVDLEDNFDSGLREVRLRLRETAVPTGLTVGQLGAQVRSAIYGREARRITRNREDVKIMVRYPEEFRQNLHHLDSMWIPVGIGPNREWVPLGEVAEVNEARSYSTIHRSQQQRSISVLGNVNSTIASTNDILAKVRATFVPQMQEEHPGIRIEFLGSAEEQAKSFSSLKMAMLVSLLVIFTLLAGLFRSYAQPLVVMSAIPFGFQGAVVGHWMTGNPMTIMSAIGMVALTGILVNDSLVLVDFINTRIRAGQSYFEASVQGAKLRLRAILLTTATTVAGLMPLMFETSFQAKFLIPMAVTLTFGLMFATGLTLIIVPCLNMIFFDFCRSDSSDENLPGNVITETEEEKTEDAPELSLPEPIEPEPVAMPRLSET